jgi:hypothetical protein
MIILKRKLKTRQAMLRRFIQLLQKNDQWWVLLNTAEWQLVFKNWHCILPEDGPCVPKHVGEAQLKFLLINTVHLIGKTNGERSYTKCMEWRT